MTKPLYDPALWKQYTTREALTRWLALPDKHRIPPTQKDLAEILDVTQERLSRIKQEAGFFEEVDKYRRMYFKEFTSTIISAIVDKAKAGDPRAQKLFLQYVEDWKETTRQEQDIHERREFVFMLSPEKYSELLQIVQEKRALEAKRYAAIDVVNDAEICSDDTKSG
jgi:hypothetical protein